MIDIAPIPLLLAAALALPAALTAQSPPLTAADREVLRAPGATHVPAEGVTVPLEGRGMVEVRVNGQGPFRFILDTTGGPTELTPRTAERLGVRATGQALGVPAAHVDSVQIGGAVFRDVAVVTPDFLPPSIDGIVGFTLFREVLLTVDVPGQTLRIENGTLPSPNGRDVLRTVPVERWWAVEIDVAGTRVPALVMLASDGAIGVPATLAPTLPLTAQPVGIGRVRTPTGASERQVARLAGDVAVGGYAFERPLLSIVPPLPGRPATASLGRALLRNFTVTFDQRGGAVRLARVDASPFPAPPALRDFGFVAVRGREGAYVVDYVTAGTPAERAGVREGDVLVSIAGRPAAAVSAGEWERMTAADAPVTFRFARDGVERDVTIAPVVLVA